MRNYSRVVERPADGKVHSHDRDQRYHFALLSHMIPTLGSDRRPVDLIQLSTHHEEDAHVSKQQQRQRQRNEHGHEDEVKNLIIGHHRIRVVLEARVRRDGDPRVRNEGYNGTDAPYRGDHHEFKWRAADLMDPQGKDDFCISFVGDGDDVK